MQGTYSWECLNTCWKIGNVDSDSWNKRSSSKANQSNHRMPWPVASPETVSSLFYKMGRITDNSLVGYDQMCENKHSTQLHFGAYRLTMAPNASLRPTFSLTLSCSDPAGASLATLCHLGKQFHVCAEHEAHPGCGLAEVNRHNLNMTAAAFP